jgi:hypothetical protein
MEAARSQLESSLFDRTACAKPGTGLLFYAVALLRNQFEANEAIFTPNVEQAV